ncbi:MAG: MFS transporter [Candidatus Omnitrophota bacterium]
MVRFHSSALIFYSVAKFSEIFKNKNFSLLWLSQVISQFGDRLDQMALIALIYSRAPGSTWEMAKLFSCTIIPVFLIGPVAGVYVDRWSRQRTMFICDLIRAGLVFVIAFSLINLKPIFPIYFVIFLVFSIGRFFVPAKMSIIPDLVKKDDLLLANSLVNTTGMIAAMFGLGLGGFLVSPSILGVRGGFYLDAATFFISAILIYFISEKIKLRVSGQVLAGVSKDIAEVVNKSVRSVRGEIKEGIYFLVSNRQTRYVVAVLFTIFAALGAVYVVAIVFVQEILGFSTTLLGILAMSMGAGLFLGSLVYGRLGHKLSHLKIIFACLCLSGILLFLFAFLTYSLRQFAISALISGLLGLALSPIITASNTLVHNLSDSNMMGRVFSSVELVMHLGFFLAMIISAILAEFLGRFWILVGVGFVVIFFGILGLIGEMRQHA